MRIIKREHELYRLRIECEDDLWTLARICTPGRSLGMMGERRDQTTGGIEGGRANPLSVSICGYGLVSSRMNFKRLVIP